MGGTLEEALEPVHLVICWRMFGHLNGLQKEKNKEIQQTAGNAHGQAKNVDQRVELISKQAAYGNLEVVFEHSKKSFFRNTGRSKLF